MMYIARCKKGLVVAGAIANTPIEQAEAADDVKAWKKKGWKVTLEHNETPHEWCFEDINCKLCIRKDV